MANPFSGIITAQFKQTFTDAISALLEDTALTVPCTLIFANTKLQDCPNCLYVVISKKSIMHVYSCFTHYYWNCDLFGFEWG